MADPSSQTVGGAAPDPADPPDPLLGRTLATKYKLEKKLGEGGMGAVYKARQLALEKTIAVKVMHAQLASDPMFAARFHREAKAASRLDHANSISILDYGEEPDGLLYIAMEFLDGRDLLGILEVEAPLPTARIVDILSQALSALAVAHDMGIIHRDLKPENIMVLRRKGEDERIHDVVKVCDFGIAKVADTVEVDETVPADGKKKNSKLTTAGLVIGTPEYMSPEQGRGEALDARCDLYSMGVILYLLLSGQTPFDAPTPLGIVLKHQSEEPLPPSRYRPEADLRLEAVCLKAMSKRPSDRYATAREMRNALRAVVDGTTEMTVPPSTSAPSRTPSGNIAHARTELLVPPPTQVVQSGGFHTAHTEALVPHTTGDAVPAVEAARATTGATPTPASRPTSRWPLIAVGSIVALGVLGGGAFYGRTLLQSGSEGPGPSSIAVKPAPPQPSPPHSPAQVPSSVAPPASGPHELLPAPVTSMTATKQKGVPPAGAPGPRMPLGGAVNATPTPPPDPPPAVSPVAPPSPPPVAPAAPVPPPFDPKGAHIEASGASIMGGGTHEGAVNRIVRSALDAMTRCYQDSATATSPEGAWNLHLKTDDSGNLVDVNLDGPLPARPKKCIQDAVLRSVRGPLSADTGILNATVLLTFKLR